MFITKKLLISTTAFLLTMMPLAQAAELPTVKRVDIPRYMGTWYEIARLPMYFQRNCVRGSQANYTLNDDGSINVLNRCYRSDGTMISAQGLAKATDASASKLRVTFLPKAIRWLPFGKADYWILRLDDNYQTVLVGTPNHKYLWILSRSAQLNQAVYEDYVKTAQSLGYDVSKLVRYPQ